MQYNGPERRRHKVLITKNTEYHMRDAECIAVRDCRTGKWHMGHKALGSQLIGSLGAGASYVLHPGPQAIVGARLCFASDLLTSPVLQVRRPSQETVARYRLR